MKIQKMKYIKMLATAAILISISSSFFAISAQSASCSGGNVNNHDYSDAPGSYGVACNDSGGRWQALGPNESGADTYTPGNTGDENNTGYKRTTAYKTWTAEGVVNSGIDGDMKTNGDGVAVDTDNGVHWRTSLDGGITWSDYGNGDITQGDRVEYRFGVARSTTGTHEYDRLKVWADWNVDGDFDNDASEILYEKDWALHKDSNGNATNSSNPSEENSTQNTDLTGESQPPVYNSSQYFSYFTQQVTIPIDALTGDTWLRARIVCENAIDAAHGDSNSPIMLATGYYNQGETEDYKFKILAKAVDVPEPSTLLVFALGLLGVTVGRKKLKNS
ncbi:MAG: hypothetical protein ACI8Y3_000106 [Paraglaciecola sp.]|jgi:hypothetical protein